MGGVGMKKIMMISPSVPDPRMMNRVRALRGHYRIVFYYWDRLNESIEPDMKGVERTYIRKKGRSRGMRLRTLIGYWGFILQGIRLLNHEQPHIIQAFRYEGLMTAFLYRFWFDRSVKVVYEVADLPSAIFPRGKSLWKKALAKISGLKEKRWIKKCSLIIFTSPGFYDFYYKKFASALPKVYQECLVAPGVLDKYQKHPRDFKPLVIGYFGNMRYLNTIKTLLDAVEGEPGLRVELAGFTQDETKLDKLLKKYKQATYHGIFPSGGLWKYYSMVDVIYCAYDTDDKNALVLMPNKFYEAVELGLPLIVSRGTYLAKRTEQEGIGYAVDESDSDELRRLLLSLTDDDFERIRKASEEARERYRVDDHNPRLLVAYREHVDGD